MVDLGLYTGVLGNTNPLHNRFAPMQDVQPSGLPVVQQEALTRRMFNTQYDTDDDNAIVSVGKYAAAAGIDFVDSIWGNTLNPVGDRNDLWNFIGDYGGDAGRSMERFYQRNQGGVELTSGIGGAVLTGWAASAYVLPRISNALAASSAINGSRLWQSGAVANAAARAEVLALAEGNKAIQMYKNPILRSFITGKTMKYAGVAAFEELAITAAMNGNNAVWSDEMSTNMFWAAFGVGLGGTLGQFAARAELRKLYNDPAIIKARVDSIDYQGLQGLFEYDTLAPAGQKIPGAEAKDSASFTNLMLMAEQKMPPGATPEQETYYRSLKTAAKEQAIDYLQRLASKGNKGQNKTQFRVADSLGKHLEDTAINDPPSFFGMESIGAVKGRSRKQLFDERQSFIDDLKASKQIEDIRLGGRLEEQKPHLLVNRTWQAADLDEAAEIMDYVPGRVEFRQVPGTHEFHFKNSRGLSMKVNESFNVKNFSSLKLSDKMRVVEGMHVMMDSMRRSGQKFQIPSTPTWLQIDAARYFEKKGGEVDWQPSGLLDDDSRIGKSLSLKFNEIGQVSIGNIWERLSYNLPSPSSLERINDGHGDSLRAALDAVAKGAPVSDAEKIYAKVKAHFGVALEKDRVTLEGNLFDFNRDDAGKWRDLGLAYFANEKYMKPVTLNGLADQMLENKSFRFSTLTAAPKLFVTALTKALTSMPEYLPSTLIRGASDEQVSGLGNAFSQVIGEGLTAEMRRRENVLTLAAQKIREAANRLTDSYINTIFKTYMADVVQRINAAPATGSKALVNQFFSNTSGWDLAKKTTMTADGFHAFILEESVSNAKRLGRDVAKDELLRNPRTGNLIVLDDLGMEFLTRANKIFEHVRQNKNVIRRAMGLSELRKKNWWVPPLRTKGQYVGFTLDVHNQPIPGGAIVAPTQAQFNKLIAAKKASLNPGEVFYTVEELHAAGDLWDRAAMDFIDPGVGAAPAKGQTGSLAMDTVNHLAINDTLKWMKDQFEQIGTNTIRTLYTDQLMLSRTNSAIARRTQGLDPKNKQSPLRTIWDEYEMTLLNKTASQIGRSVIGGPIKRWEDTADILIENAWPALQHLGPSTLNRWIGDLARHMGVKKLPQTQQTFAELAKTLGNYTPYKNAVDYAEQTLKVSRPPRVREISDKMNWLSATIVLRAAEISHAAMNMIGIITTMPSIVASGNAPLLTVLNGKKGPVKVIDSMRIMTGAVKDMMSKKSHADWAEMVKNGDATQQIAEFNKQLGLISDKKAFERIMLGTGDTQGRTGIRGKFNESGIDGLISYASDTTENWSRQWSHFIGLRLADHHGITGTTARHDFARDIANAAIANYSPINRPELYQSAIGSLFGLFASYVQSYNQRLFRWMEDGEYANIGRQLAMQSALFGLASAPGYKQMESALLAAGVGNTEDGEEATLADNIYARFGPEIGSAILHGGIAETGIVLFTRGDMNYRDVSLNPTQLMAAVGVMGQVANMVKEVGQHMVSSAAIEDSGAVSEIIARNMPNRTLKGMLTTILNEGQDIDSRGQIVAETKGAYETILRSIGLRHTRQQAEIEAFYTDKRLQDREAARMDVLRMETRALLREPGWENRLQEVFDKYVKNGGRPAHFRTWIKDQVRSAQSTRGMNSLAKALRSDKNQSEIWRYNAYGAL